MSVIGSKSQKDELIELGPDFYEVERILEKRTTRKGDEYLIKWKNFPNPQDFTWEPMEHLYEVMHLVEQFNQRTKEKKKGKGKEKQKVDESKLPIAKKIDETERNAQESDESEKGKKKEKGIVKKREYKKRVKKVQEQNQKSHSQKKSQNEEEVGMRKRRIKEEKGKAVAVLNNTFTGIIDNSQLDKKRWFLEQPFRLGQIYKHRIEGDRISFYVDVETTYGNLVCLTQLSDREIEEIDIEKQKDYILDYLLQIKKNESKAEDKEYQEFEEIWRNV